MQRYGIYKSEGEVRIRVHSTMTLILNTIKYQTNDSSSDDESVDYRQEGFYIKKQQFLRERIAASQALFHVSEINQMLILFDKNKNTLSIDKLTQLINAFEADVTPYLRKFNPTLSPHPVSEVRKNTAGTETTHPEIVVTTPDGEPHTVIKRGR